MSDQIADHVDTLFDDLRTQGATITQLNAPIDAEPGLTVAELIIELQRLPPAWKVKVKVGVSVDLGDGFGLETWRGVVGWEAGDGQVLLDAAEDE